MIKTTTMKIPEREVRYKNYICDVCGDDCDDEDGRLTSQSRVYARVGTDHGGMGGDWKQITFDVCAGCFRSKVVPALKAIGLKPRVEERNW